jgi:hypothetical protein
LCIVEANDGEFAKARQQLLTEVEHFSQWQVSSGPALAARASAHRLQQMCLACSTHTVQPDARRPLAGHDREQSVDDELIAAGKVTFEHRAVGQPDAQRELSGGQLRVRHHANPRCCRLASIALRE